MKGKWYLLTQFPDLAWRKWRDKRVVRTRLNGEHPNFLHEATLLLTFRCPLRCPMCPEWGEKGLFLGREKMLHREELSVEKWIEIVRELQPFKPVLVVLGGGEPLLFEGWAKIAASLQKFTKVMAISNGLTVSSQISSILEHIDILHLSLDGNREAHDAIRGQGTYQKAIQNLKKLIAERSKSRGEKPFIRIAATLLPGVSAHLKEMIAEVSRIGVDGIIVQHLMFLNRGEIEALSNCSLPFQKEFWQSYALTLPKTEQFLKELTDFHRWLKGSPYRRSVQFHPALAPSEWQSFYQDRVSVPLSFQRRCLAPLLQLTVLPSGEVWLCPGLTVGNLQEERLSKLFNSKRVADLNRALAKEFPFPVCAGCCYLYGYT